MSDNHRHYLEGDGHTGPPVYPIGEEPRPSNTNARERAEESRRALVASPTDDGAESIYIGDALLALADAVSAAGVPVGGAPESLRRACCLELEAAIRDRVSIFARLEEAVHAREDAKAERDRLRAELAAIRDAKPDTAAAFMILQDALRGDPGFAWAWHSTLAMSAVDEGVDHATANRAAARFMQLCFGVTTREPGIDNGATLYCEGSDTCAKCGLDLRNEIHQRAARDAAGGE
jgi:hypothetical protein